jgi:catechol 2,3-dioxygenase-like lactoylglutathione lyase family enzyme
MNQRIGEVCFLVRDYDEAIEFFLEKLSFRLVEDTNLENGKRWVRVAPPGSLKGCLLLAKAVTPDQADRVGNQTGDRVFLFLYTDDFWRDHESMKKNGVQFLEIPRTEPYGIVVQFKDLYGNKWDLLQTHEK